MGEYGVKIRTAPTRRAIDKWKGKARAQARMSQYWALDFVTQLLTSSKRWKVVFIPPLILVLSFNFAAFELGILILVSFFITKLQCYRFANSVMNHLPFPG